MNWKLKTAIAALAVTAFTWNVSAADAQANWDKQCAKCHGKEGKGDTKMGQKLKCKDYTDAKVQAAFSDEEATKIIKEGKKEGSRTVMKGYASTLSDADIKALVDLIRKMKK